MLGTQLTVKSQVTVPKVVRDSLGIGPGDRVYFVSDGERAIMVPLKGDIWSLRGALKKYAKGKSFNWKKIRRDVQGWRAERQARILEESRGHQR